MDGGAAASTLACRPRLAGLQRPGQQQGTTGRAHQATAGADAGRHAQLGADQGNRPPTTSRSDRQRRACPAHTSSALMSTVIGRRRGVLPWRRPRRSRRRTFPRGRRVRVPQDQSVGPARTRIEVLEPAGHRSGGSHMASGSEPVSAAKTRSGGADDSDGGVSPTHRGRAGSAHRSPASRTSWSRPGPAGRLR